MSLFLLTVFGLLLGAGIKGKMEKAGLEPRFNWAVGRELWEVRWALWLACPPVETDGYAGTRTTQTFGRVWAWGAKPVRRSRWWSTGRVQHSARFGSGLTVDVTRIIYFITIFVEDIKST